MMQPGIIVVPVRRQIHFQNPAHAGNILLEVPALLPGAVVGDPRLDLVRDDAAGIGSRRGHRFGAQVIVEDAPLAQRLVVHFLILDGVLMATGRDAPGMEVIELFVFGVAGDDLCILAPLGTQNLHHPALPFGGPAVRTNGHQRSSNSTTASVFAG